MFWKLFGSEQRVQEALEQSIGYDISPNILNHKPANDIPPSIEAEAAQLGLWREHAFSMPANTQDKPRASHDEPKERRKA